MPPTLMVTLALTLIPIKADENPRAGGGAAGALGNSALSNLKSAAPCGAEHVLGEL